MALNACEHCGLVCQDLAGSRMGHCPNCNVAMVPVTLPVAGALLRRRLRAQRHAAERLQRLPDMTLRRS